MKLVKKSLIEKIEKVYNLHIKNNHNYFANEICVSNCHGAKSDSIQSVLKKCVNAEYRIGMTGTMPEELTNQYTIYGYLGPKIFETKSSELIEKGVLSKIKIANINLQYPKETVFEYWHDDEGDIQQKEYQEELDIIYGNTDRNKIFRYIINRLDKTQNVLILCHKISHLKDIKKYLEENFKEYEIEEIYGKIEAQKREDIRQSFDRKEKIKIYFDNICIEVNNDEKIPLKNGEYKLAKDISENDDIEDFWIKNHIFSQK